MRGLAQPYYAAAATGGSEDGRQRKDGLREKRLQQEIVGSAFAARAEVAQARALRGRTTTKKLAGRVGTSRDVMMFQIPESRVQRLKWGRDARQRDSKLRALLFLYRDTDKTLRQATIRRTSYEAGHRRKIKCGWACKRVMWRQQHAKAELS